MKKSKQSKASEREDGVDMISNLPDPVLQLILSCLPTTEEVIRTSILSTRWRYLWTSVPSLNIDYARGLNPLKQFKSNKFKEFVYWVLANKSLDLDSFRLCCPVFYSISTIKRWIHIAVTKNLKQLHLLFCPRKKFEVPHCLVTCSSLEVLKLFLFKRRLSLPNFTGFRALRVLELDSVELFNDYSVEHFLESFPVLEELSLLDCLTDELSVFHISCPKLKRLTIRCWERVPCEESDKDMVMCDKLRISCPKLVFLMLTGYVAGIFSFENLYSLKEVVIHPEEMDEWERPIVDGFVGISRVESLSISLYCIGMCEEPPDYVPVSLPNLKTLELTTGVFAMDVLIPFLICFPDLESLSLIITQVDRLEDWKLDDAATMKILTHRLKRVEFLGFDGDEWKVVVARSLLEHGNALEDMAFLWRKEAEYHEKSMEAMKEVSKFYKASSNVKLRSVIE